MHYHCQIPPTMIVMNQRELYSRANDILFYLLQMQLYRCLLPDPIWSFRLLVRGSGASHDITGGRRRTGPSPPPCSCLAADRQSTPACPPSHHLQTCQYLQLRNWHFRSLKRRHISCDLIRLVLLCGVDEKATTADSTALTLLAMSGSSSVT